MPVFKYKALTQDGKTVKGIQEAENERHARSELRAINLIATNLTKVKTGSSNKKKLFTIGISAKNLSDYIRQLALMISSGLDVEASLAVLIDKSNNKKGKIIWTAVKSSINEGVSLSDAMLNFPDSFPNFIIAAVKSGEQSGKLGEVLTNISNDLIKSNKFIASVTNAIIYPIIVTLVAFSVIVVLLTFVVPQIVEVFSQLDEDLPVLTIGLIAVSDFVANYIDVFLFVILFAFIFIKWLKSNNVSKKYWDKFWLKIPITKNFIKEVNAIRFMRTMATLTTGSVVMIDAIHYASSSVNNLALVDKIQLAKDNIKEGKSVFLSFSNTNIFDTVSLQLINLGEITGKMDKSLTDIANMLEDDFNERINRYLSVFEPLLILIMGVLVLIIVLAILLPIFDLNQVISS